MRVSPRALAVVLLAAACSAAAAWWLLGRRAAAPLAVPASALASWTVVTSDGTDAWVVGARPPAALTRALLAAASTRAGRPLVAPPHPAMPLVLQSEFEDSLQGVYGTDSVVRLARDGGLESARFQPVCLAEQTVEAGDASIDIYFIPFESPAFNEFRTELTPLEPEHAGIGVYDPATLTPALLVGATADAFDRVWPIRFDAARDCRASIAVGEQGAAAPADVRTGTGG